MFKQTSPAPQKKSGIGATQQKPLEKEVMEAVKRNGKPSAPAQVEKAVEQLKQVLATNKIDPKIIVQAGQLAQKAWKDPAQYEMAKDMLVKNKILTAEQAKSTSREFILGTAIIAGKLAERIGK